MINNFELIGNYIQNYENRFFYDCQVIRRGKDNPELPSANHTIISYYIDSPELLKARQQEIITFCNHFNARAYINLAPKSFEKLAKLTNFRLAERIFNGDFKKIYKTFNSCAGELKGENDAWVVDIDSKDYSEQAQWVNHWFTSYNFRKDSFHERLKSIKLVVPTLNGWHLITDSFNLQEFKKEFPNVDVHKNNPTLLYYNDILSK